VEQTDYHLVLDPDPEGGFIAVALDWEGEGCS